VGGKDSCGKRGEPGVVKPRLIDNGKDGTRLASAHPGCGAPQGEKGVRDYVTQRSLDKIGRCRGGDAG
jgi:hypothetical protein